MLRTAEAAAELEDVEAAIGWLSTAYDYDPNTLFAFLAGNNLKKIKNNPAFENFLKKISIE